MKAGEIVINNLLLETVTTFTTLWKIVRTDGQVFGLTEYYRDIDYDDGTDDITYVAVTGGQPTSMSQSKHLDVDNLTLHQRFNASGITEQDFRSGLFDGAEVTVYLVAYDSLTSGRHIILKKGILGESTLRGNVFECEVRGLAQKLQQSVGEVYTPTCRADLGDTRCGVSVAAFTQSATVATVENVKQKFTVSSGVLKDKPSDDETANAPSRLFAGGKLTWTSGNNSGKSIEVLTFQNVVGVPTFTLFEPMYYDIEVGDGFDVYAGCTKRLPKLEPGDPTPSQYSDTWSDCRDRFDNVVNFRGEPFVPGKDVLLFHPDSKAS